ncbi:glucosyl hydrolase [Pleomorphomonas sp. PLEO]|uniref:glucosyl hydrolase n=1 Tax=Pleomorphomonas sp. PLEO TaxID=3239306 RepID=UPI00351DD42F
MKWRKLGLVWSAGGADMPAFTHGMAPTPFLLSDDVLRIYLTVIDTEGRGHARYVDVSAYNPKQVLGTSRHEVLGPGEPGAFDDNGLMPLSLVRSANDKLFLYYAGFELCRHIRYRIFTGLAVSEDNGRTFLRYSRVPILDRADGELYFRGGPFVLAEGDAFRMWYVAGDNWIDLGGKQMPVYDMRYIESVDGQHWPQTGRVSLALTHDDEHGFGRPWVVRRAPQDYQLFYSVRRKSLGAYRLGYAESNNGIDWVRKDEEMGLDVSPVGFDSQAIMYSAVVSAHGKTYCFYNGNDFGKEGFAVAELVE